MSTPNAKRRRLNEAAKTLHKPFKSPFRTPLRPSLGSDPPSSDPLEVLTPNPAFVQDAILNQTNDRAAKQADGEQSSSGSHAATIARAPKLPTPRSNFSILMRPPPKRSSPKNSPANPSLTRTILQVRTDLQILSQAAALATSTKDEDLVLLIERWRTASRAAAEELFASTRDRVNRMGGVGAWKEREREAKERRGAWEMEERREERERLAEMREGGEEVVDEGYGDFDVSEERDGEQKEEVKGADDDSFTMDMMLKMLNVDLKLIGYNKEAQRWEG